MGGGWQGSWGDLESSGGGGMLETSMGGTLSPGLVFGIGVIFHAGGGDEITAKTDSGSLTYSDRNISDLSLDAWLVGPMCDFFPDPTTGFHIGGTLGWTHVSVPSILDLNIDSKTGLGGRLSLGYDFWVGRQQSLGLLLSATGATTTFFAPTLALSGLLH